LAEYSYITFVGNDSKLVITHKIGHTTNVVKREKGLQTSSAEHKVRTEQAIKVPALAANGSGYAFEKCLHLILYKYNTRPAGECSGPQEKFRVRGGGSAIHFKRCQLILAAVIERLAELEAHEAADLRLAVEALRLRVGGDGLLDLPTRELMEYGADGSGSGRWWTEADEEALLRYMRLYRPDRGYVPWKDILEMGRQDGHFLGRNAANLKDKWVNIGETSSAK
jgi:hypothetical protein